MKSTVIICGALLSGLASLAHAVTYNGGITTNLTSSAKDSGFYYSKQVQAGPNEFNKALTPAAALIADAGGIYTSSTISANASGISATSQTHLPSSFDYNTYYGSSSEIWTFVDQAENIDLTGKNIRFLINYSIDQDYFNTSAGVSFYVFSLGYMPIFSESSNTFSNHITGQWQSDWISGGNSLDYLLRVQTSAAATNHDMGAHSASSWATLSYQVVAVPEPETYAMLSLGLLVVAGVARRKKTA